MGRRNADNPAGHEFLNSFIMRDLGLVAERAAKGDIGAALREYLRPDKEISEVQRVDVRSQLDAVLVGDRFRRAVASFADENDIPWVRFGKDDVGTKLELMRPHLDRQAATGCSGIAAIGVAQEFQRVWSAYERPSPTGAWQWWFTGLYV